VINVIVIWWKSLWDRKMKNVFIITFQHEERKMKNGCKDDGESEEL